jgi:hypothetical protein
MTSWQTDFFGPQLLTKEGVKSTSDVLAGKKYIGKYNVSDTCYNKSIKFIF